MTDSSEDTNTTDELNPIGTACADGDLQFDEHGEYSPQMADEPEDEIVSEPEQVDGEVIHVH